jgi:hypothetical protein
VRIRSTALPPEHGSWGLVSEPLALGLLLAPSTAGLCIAVGAFATFLTRRPLKVALAEWGRARSERRAAGRTWQSAATQRGAVGPNRRRPQVLAVAVWFAALYGGIAVLGFAGSVLLAGTRPLLPLLLACPLLLVFLAYDFRNQSRAWQAELAGAVVFAVVAASTVLAGGWRSAPAFAVAAVWIARTVSSILYVRNRIRLDRNRPHQASWVLGLHVAVLLVVCGLAREGLLPWLVAVPFAALLARAVIGLSPYRRLTTLRGIGLREMGYGLLTITALVVGYWMRVS